MASTTKSVLIEVGEDPAGVLLEGTTGYTLHVVHPKLTHLHGSAFKSVQAAQVAVRDALKDRPAKAG